MNKIQNCSKVITRKEQSSASDVRHLFDRCQHIAPYILPVLFRTGVYGTYPCTGCDDHGTQRCYPQWADRSEMMVGHVDRRVNEYCGQVIAVPHPHPQATCPHCACYGSLGRVESWVASRSTCLATTRKGVATKAKTVRTTSKSHQSQRDEMSSRNHCRERWVMIN